MQKAKERLEMALQKLIQSGEITIKSPKKDVADAMGASVANVSSAFNGNERYLTDNFLIRFNEAFGNRFELDWLRGYDSDSTKHIPEAEFKKTYLLPMSAMGGTLSGFTSQAMLRDCEVITSPITDVDFAITIYGESMAPDYPSGSKVLIKRINEKAFIKWGEVYILDTCNGIVLKKIDPVEGDENKVMCISINGEFKPFTIKMTDIYGWYKVMMCMSIKNM